MVFESIKQLLNGSAPMRDVTVSWEEYEQFKVEYIWSGLKGISYANAFCRHFKIVDYILSSINDPGQADGYILRTYIGKTNNVHEYYDDISDQI